MRAIAFLRSLVIVLAAGVAVPIGLVAASQWRFGGASPLTGVPAPSRWSAEGLRALLVEPLTDRTLTDGAIHVAMIVAWLAIGVFVLTVMAETAHMVRHGGHHLPDVRGLRWSQHGARAVAAGLLALVPLLTQGSPAIAGGGSSLLVRAAPVVARPTPSISDDRGGAAEPAPQAQASAPVVGEYVVRTGDSVFAIAEHLAGPDHEAVATYAERILDLNLGREMAGGERFTNPGLIDAGWVLHLPPVDPRVGGVRAVSERHVVNPGESLWSIAGDELGDPTRWPELFELNAERTFPDGRTFDDPALLRPGWDLVVAAADVPVVVAEEPPPVAEPHVVIDHDSHYLDSDYLDSSLAADTEQPPAAPELAAPVSEVEHAAPAVRSENRWVSAGDAGAVAEPDAPRESDDDAAPELLTIRRGVMLAGGVLTLAGVRRRRRLREAQPRARFPEPLPRVETIERELRGSVVGERMARVDLATRAAALPLIDSGQRLAALLVNGEAAIEMIATGPSVLPSPWQGAGDRWILPAAVALESLATDARRVNAPCPALVQLGVDELGRDVFVDLEALGALEVGGSTAQRDAIVAAIAATLAGSVLAEVTTLLSVGVPTDAFLGHRLHTPVPDVSAALAVACTAVGPMSTMQQPVFELRARGTAGETWDPAVVLVGSDADTLQLPHGRPGLAVVSASRIEGPSSTLYPDGDAWLLRPLGLRLLPIGLVPDDLAAISDLVNRAPIDDSAMALVLDSDRTIYADDFGDDRDLGDDLGDEHGDDHHDDDGVGSAERSSAGENEWDLLVRLYGSVGVVDRDGHKVAFERSKTTELVAWLATHRDRSTRANARTALWEQDVRDATFANVVSEARRALARLVAPPDGEEWVGRTLTEALPLHPRVITDADVLGRALAAARGQTPSRSVELLRGPVASIAGLPFEGTSYLWPDSEGISSNLILLATSAAAALAGHCLQLNDIDGVFEATARGLRVLPGHEELIGLRMRAHARAGDHAAVRQEWSSYERVVNADPWSDGEPSPKLVDLRKELLHPGV